MNHVMGGIINKAITPRSLRPIYSSISLAFTSKLDKRTIAHGMMMVADIIKSLIVAFIVSPTFDERVTNPIQFFVRTVYNTLFCNTRHHYK
jgi:hypothetical protein